jgi:hypothetical protein
MQFELQTAVLTRRFSSTVRQPKKVPNYAFKRTV